MAIKINYKGRVWTCNEHHAIIEGLLLQGMLTTAQGFLHSVHPKKGNSCKECAESYEDTPPCNR